MKELTIGYDAKKIVTNFTGIGNYSRATVNIMSRFRPSGRHLLFTPVAPYQRWDEMPTGDNVEYIVPEGLHIKEWWRCVGVKDDLRRHGVSLYHGLSNELPFGINKVCASVVTIHDLIFMRYPQAYGRLQRAILEYKTRRACREATRIIAISEATRRDIIELYGIDERRIDLVYQGCNSIFRQRVSDERKAEVRRLHGLSGQYIVAVGTLEWRKNQEALVRALPSIHKDLCLLLVGRGEREKRRLESLAAELGVASRMKILTNVGFAELPAIYQSAWAAAYVSRIEGFGIPALEAAVSGIPLVAATGTCLEEAGGPGGIYCSPDSPGEIAEAFNHLYSHHGEAAARVRASQDYAYRFTDRNIAQNLLDVYRKAL